MKIRKSWFGEGLSPGVSLETLEGRVFMHATPRSIVQPVAARVHRLSAAVVTAVQAATSTTTDTLVFGNASVESAHGLAGVSTQIISGALGQSARQLLPLSTPGVNGGDMTFTMKVDPKRLNYFTLKFWGGDGSPSDTGRLYVYLPKNGVNYQVGYRHEGDQSAALSVGTDSPPFPGRFYYSTIELPLAMTLGQTSMTIEIISTGRIFTLGSGDQNSGGNYQFNMTTPSRGIYAAYTHVDPLLDVSGEVQGSMPTATIRPSPGVSVIQSGGTFYNNVANYLKNMLATTTSVSNFTTQQALYLSQAYSVSALTATYHSSALVTKVIGILDAYATDYFTTPANVSGGGNEGWGGRYGNLGWAIHLLSSAGQLPSSVLNTRVNYGTAGGTRTRRAAWGAMLQASRDYGRFNRDNWDLTNQSMLANTSIYEANRGMIDLGSANAFTDTTAQRYILEAAGISPWLGSDLSTGSSSYKFGKSYYQVTPAGLTREWGYVGLDYGELESAVADLYAMTGNAAFKTQAIKMLKARAAFRKPDIDSSGYQSMEGIGLLAWRGADESDGTFADDLAYGDRTGNTGLHTAALTLDPTAVGYAKQMLADNQFFNSLTGSDSRIYTNPTALSVFSDYAAVNAAADPGTRLPMSNGQPDFVWSDPNDGILAIKHGDDRLWVAPFWQAKTGTGVNGVARFEYSTPQYEQYGDMGVTPKVVSSGAYFVRPNLVDKPEENFYTPPDNPSQAFAGQVLPLVASPDSTTIDDTPWRGKASFYTLRLGHYLIGMNVSTDQTFTLRTPVGFTSATDLVTNTVKSGTISIAPQSTAVLYLDSATDAAPVPDAPLSLIAQGSVGQAKLMWSAASGADSYIVKRATNHGGPYTTVASGLTGTTFTDTGLTPGQSYYYVVDAINANGTSDNSMTAVAGLPGALSNQDIGSPALVGTSYLDNGAITVSGSGNDIGGTSDQFQFAYHQVSGNTTLVARVDPMDTNGIDKSGVMIRESLDPASKLAALLLQPDGSARLATRTTTGGSMSWSGVSGIHGRYWVKLVRSGNVMTASISPDGTNWTQIAQQAVAMNASVYVGLASCSTTSTQTSAAVFDNVQIAGVDLTPPTLQSATSSKIQGTDGTFALPLSLDSSMPTVEPRLGGPTKITYSFSEPVMAADGVLDANEFTITNATFQSANISGSLLTLNLSGVALQSRVSIALQDISDLSGNMMSPLPPLVIKALYGDVNQSSDVSISDQQAVKNALFQTVTTANYLMDVNTDGSISISDQQAVKNALFSEVD